MGFNPNIRGNSILLNGVDLSQNTPPAGSTAIGDNDNYINISPSSANVKSTLEAIDAFLSAGSGANTTLSNLTSPTAINQNLEPDASDVRHLGGPTAHWENIYADWMFSADNNTSIGIDTRILYDANADTPSIDWNTRYLFDAAGDVSIQYDAKSLDSGAAGAVNWGLRVLQNTLGSDVLNWSGLTAGSPGQFLQTDGSGNASWQTVTAGVTNPLNNNVNLQWKDSGGTPTDVLVLNASDFIELGSPWTTTGIDLEASFGFMAINASNTPDMGEIDIQAQDVLLFSPPGSTAPTSLKFFDATPSRSFNLRAPALLTADTTLAWPDGVGTVGQFLTTDGNNPGQLSWTSGVSFVLSDLVSTNWGPDVPAIEVDGTTAEADANGAAGILFNGSDTSDNWFLLGTGDKASTIKTANIGVESGYQSGTGDSGKVRMSSGAADGGTSGNVELRVGTGSTQGNIIFLKNGVPSVVGQIWTATGTGGEGYWAAAAASGANTTLSNLGTTAVNADIRPATEFSSSLGTQSLGWNNVWARRFSGTDTGGVNRFTITAASTTTLPSGTNVNVAYLGQSTNSLGFATSDLAGATAEMRFETGNSSANASGNITLLIGTASTTQGSIKFLKNGVASVVGQVWTATGTDGSGYWAAASGANTTLSNLGTTSINADLLPSGAATRSLGSTTLPWNNIVSKSMQFYDTGPLTAVAFLDGDGGSVPSGSGTVRFSIQNGLSSATQNMAMYTLSTTGAIESGSLFYETGNQNTATIGAFRSGSLLIKTGNITDVNNTGISGDVTLQTGTVTGATRGKIKLVDGSQGTVGHVWTESNADGSGGWAAAGANTALSNLASVAVNTNFTPGTTETWNLGSGGSLWLNALIGGTGSFGVRIHGASSEESRLGPGATTPSGATPVNAFQGITDNSLSVHTADRSTANATATGSLYLETGNKTAGTGASGLINLLTGTSVGGNSGEINIKTGISTAPTAAEFTGQITIQSGAITATTSEGTTGDLTFKTGDNAKNVASVPGATGTILISSGAMTGADHDGASSGGVDIRTGATKNFNSGILRIESGESEWQSGVLWLRTGNGLVADDAWSGNILVETGHVTGTAESGKVEIQSGTSEDGASGTINLVTGVPSGTGERGFINMDALFTIAPRQSADPTHAGLVAGAVYYNTGTNKLKMYNGSTWETVVSA